MASLRDELARQRLHTSIEEEKAKQAAARSEASSQKRAPRLRGLLIGFGAIISSLGVGDSLRPDTPDLMANATKVELAIFHNEGDPEKLMAFGTALIGGAQIRRKKRPQARLRNG